MESSVFIISHQWNLREVSRHQIRVNMNILRRTACMVALPRHQEEEKTDKNKQAQIEQTYEKY